MMADDSPSGCDDIANRVERILKKETEMKGRREELAGLKKKFIEEHLKLGRDELAIREEISVLEELIAECNKKTAADGSVCYELPEDVVSLIKDGGGTPKQPRKPIGGDAERNVVNDGNGKTCRFTSNGQYMKVQKKKQIRTVLHSILDALNERGNIKIGDVAKEFELGEDELLLWAKVMEDKGLVEVSYSIGRGTILKKPGKG